LLKYKKIKKHTTSSKNNTGAYPKRIPPEVATALPPLNPANIGYICPITAAKPQTRGKAIQEGQPEG